MYLHFMTQQNIFAKIHAKLQESIISILHGLGCFRTVYDKKKRLLKDIHSASREQNGHKAHIAFRKRSNLTLPSPQG